MRRLHLLTSIFLLLVCFNAHSQDSVRYGRFFLGADISPLNYLLFHQQQPDLMFQFKMVSLRNPCIRYRAVFNHFQREGKHLLYVKEGKYEGYSEGYAASLRSSGLYRVTSIGAGVEQVILVKKINLILGTDVFVGARSEEELVRFVGFDGPDSLNVGSYLYGSYANTVIAGLTPFAGIETEIGERFSFQATLRGLLGFNSVTSSSRGDYSYMKPPKNRAEAYFTGVNLLFYYRF